MKILFVCVENACRSQMAEGIFNHLAKGKLRKTFGLLRGKHKAFSAGTSIAKEVNPLAIKVMKEIGIDIHLKKPKLVNPQMVKQTDIVISMGCLDSCIPIKIDENWAIEDPKGREIGKFREIREIIFQKVKDLIQRIEK